MEDKLHPEDPYRTPDPYDLWARALAEGEKRGREQVLQAVRMHATYALEDCQDVREHHVLMTFYRRMRKFHG